MPNEEITFADCSPSRADIVRISEKGQAATLKNCDLNSMDLSQLMLSGWRFDSCNLAGASWNGTRLEEVRFKGCRAAQSRFLGSELQDCTIDGGDFSNSSFRAATLSDVKFLRCKMTGCDLTDVRANNILLEEVLLVFALLPKLSFRDTLLKKVDFSDADLKYCDFRDAVLEDCSLRDAHLADCRFERADLRGADLGGVALTDARRFKGAVISKRQAADLLGQLGLRVL